MRLSTSPIPLLFLLVLSSAQSSPSFHSSPVLCTSCFCKCIARFFHKHNPMIYTFSTSHRSHPKTPITVNDNPSSSLGTSDPMISRQQYHYTISGPKSLSMSCMLRCMRNMDTPRRRRKELKQSPLPSEMPSPTRHSPLPTPDTFDILPSQSRSPMRRRRRTRKRAPRTSASTPAPSESASLPTEMPSPTEILLPSEIPLPTPTSTPIPPVSPPPRRRAPRASVSPSTEEPTPTPAVSPTSTPTSTPTSVPSPTPTSIPIARSPLPRGGLPTTRGLCETCARDNLDLVNEHRAKAGKVRLVWSAKLAEMAEKHSLHMQARNGKLFHSRKDIFENIVKDFSNDGFNGVAQSMFTIWRNSPPHNENMLNEELKCCGVGIAGDPTAEDISDRFYWGTQIFSWDCDELRN